MRLIFLGPPGAGKGTQASIVAEKFGILHISTGELLRQERTKATERAEKAKSYMDKGALVPDHIVVDMVKEQLTKPEAKKGWILDGFPRNMYQGGILDGLLIGLGQKPYNYAITFEIPEGVLVERLKKRKRSDDTLEILRNRLESYREETAPLINFYSDQQKLEIINGFASKQSVTTAIEEIVGNSK